MSKKAERPLDPVYQDADDTFSGRCATIEQAARNTGARKLWASVLRWYLEHDAHHRPVAASAKQIADSYFLEVSERTVQRAHVHWKKLGALTFKPRTGDNGSNLPPWASLNWRSVVQLACVQSAGSVREISTRDRVAEDRRNSSVDCDGPFFLTDGDSLLSPYGDQSPSPGDQSPSPGDQSPSPEPRALLISRNPIRVLACARSFCLLSSVCTVVDDDSKDRMAEFGEILVLADEARRPLYPAAWPRDPAVREAFTAGSVLALMLFSRPWLLAATRATIGAPKAANNPVRYWLGCLRNGLVEIEGLAEFPSREAHSSYFAQLMHAAEKVAQEVITANPIVEGEVPPDLPPPAGPPDAEADQRWRETLQRRAENRKRRDDQGGPS